MSSLSHSPSVANRYVLRSRTPSSWLESVCRYCVFIGKMMVLNPTYLTQCAARGCGRQCHMPGWACPKQSLMP